MNKKGSYTLASITALGIGLVGGVMLVGSINAQIDNPESAVAQVASRFHRGGGAHQELIEEYDITLDEMKEYHEQGLTMTEILEAEGIDQVEFKSKAQVQIEEHLTQLVADGKMTEEEKNEKMSNFDEHFENMLTGQGREMRGQNGQKGEAHMREVMESLGITEDEMKQYHDEGKTMSEIIDAEGIDEATVKSAVKVSLGEMLTEKVDEGKITQEEMDEALSKFDENFEARLNGDQSGGFGPGNGKGKAMHGGEGKGNGEGQGMGRGNGEGQGMGRGMRTE